MSRLSIQSWLNWLGVEVGVEEEADMGVRHFFVNCCSDLSVCCVVLLKFTFLCMFFHRYFIVISSAFYRLFIGILSLILEIGNF